MTSLALVVLTYNEEVHLARCLDSVRGLVDEMFVIDSGSRDRTADIARERGARVLEHPFTNQAEQFNWALDNARITSDWILRLDADEYLLPSLRDELSAVLSDLPSAVSGLYLRRRIIFGGRWIRHGGVYPTWLLRVFRAGKARSERLEMDEHLVVTEGETLRLRNDFVDHNRKGLSFWLGKHADYADREASILRRYESGGPAGLGQPGRLVGDPREMRRWRKQNLYMHLPLFLRAVLYFFYRYIVRLGILDGTEGLIYHFLQALWFRFYVDACLWQLRRGASSP